MNIAWFHSHFQNWMGGTKYVFEVCKRLKSKQEVDNITIFVETTSNNNRKRFENAGLRVMPLLERSSYDPLYWQLLPLYLRQMARRLRSRYLITSYDVLIASMFPMNWLICLLDARNAFQLCYEPYALFFDQTYRRGLPLIKRMGGATVSLLYKRYDIAATSKMRAIMTISNFNADWIKRVYGKKAWVVYEGVDVEFFQKKSPAELPQRYRQYSNYFTILHSTDFTPIKNTWFLLNMMPKIVQLIPNCKLLLTTTRNERMKNRVLKFATKRGFGEQLELLGFVPIEEMPFLYSIADVVVQPSIKQSMSLSVKEAMACEALVIRSNDVPQEEIISGVNGFLISPYDPDSLIEVLVNIQRMSDEEKQEIGQRARDTITTNYTWSRVVDNILGIIQGALS